MYFDSHAHLTSDALFGQIDQLLEEAKKAAVTQIINICTDVKTLERGLELKKRYPWVHQVAATTPHDVLEEGELFFPIVEKHVKELVAIGETGLDYHYEYSPKEKQKEFLLLYFALAKKSNLPLVIHCRDAFDDLFQLAEEYYKDSPAVLHCFTGNLTEAKRVLDRGWYVSFSGIVTFAKSETLREVAKYVPISQMLIETDAPYLAPQSKRGKTNHSAFLPETAEMIAKIKNVPLETIASQTFANAQSFFSL